MDTQVMVAEAIYGWWESAYHEYLDSVEDDYDEMLRRVMWSARESYDFCMSVQGG